MSSAPPAPGSLPDRPRLSLGPRGRERRADRGRTALRVLDGPPAGRVDLGGGFMPTATGVVIDWWIGADDRWYLPAREAAVRQRRLGPGPVIETAVRIPSGDAIHRCYAVAGADGPATVIEVTNASPVPVALALAVRPYDLDGIGHGPYAMALDHTDVVVNGRVVMALPRRPNEAQADAETDVVDWLRSGRALTGPVMATGPDANLVVLYPLPHTTTLRVVVPGPGGVIPNRVPDCEVVVRGWRTLLDADAQLQFPDAGIDERVAAARVRTLTAADELATRVIGLEPAAGRTLEALAIGGARAAVAPVLSQLAAAFPVRLHTPPAAAAAVVSGAARAAALLAEPDQAEVLLETLMQITHLVERSGDRVAAAEALDGLATLLSHLGRDDAAATVIASIPADLGGARFADLGGARFADLGGADLATGPVPADLDQLTALAEQASPALSWGDDEVGPAAAFWLGARGLLIDDHGPDLVLLPTFPTAWRGGNLQVGHVPTAFGEISFALRWHGARPALLWERHPIDDQPVRLRCPGLDPDWVSIEPKGEVLLAGAAEELPPPPGEGESFR